MGGGLTDWGTDCHTSVATLVRNDMRYTVVPGRTGVGPHPSRQSRATFPGGEGLGNGLPRQCEHWLAMTSSIDQLLMS